MQACNGGSCASVQIDGGITRLDDTSAMHVREPHFYVSRSGVEMRCRYLRTPGAGPAD